MNKQMYIKPQMGETTKLVKLNISINESVPFSKLEKLPGKTDIPFVLDKFEEEVTSIGNIGIDMKLVEQNMVEDSERYVHIGSAKSILTESIVDIYYDKNEKDLFIIPSLDSFGYEVPSELNVKGKIIGKNLNKEDNINGGIITESNKLILNNVNPNKTNIKTYLLGIPGAWEQTIFTGKNRYYSKYELHEKLTSPMQFISLGSTTDLFSKNVPICKFVPLGLGEYSPVIIHSGETDELLIPLVF